MNKFLKQNLLAIYVFITGACVLIIEVVAVRVLSPHYGNTIFTVSSVISVILAALSVGYYAGGKFADRHPSLQWFFGIILMSGAATLAFHFLGAVMLPILSVNFSLISGPLVSSLFLFFLPAFLLGTLSPYAIKLQSIQVPEQGIGSVSGKIFFWSTLGSIIGSLLAGFVLIPRFGISHIFIAAGIALFALGFIPLVILGVDKKRLTKLFSVFAIFVLATILAAVLATQRVKSGVLYSQDGVYEKITIYDGVLNNRPTRFFQQDRSSSGAMFLDSNDPTDLVFDYTKYYSLYKIFETNVQNALVIGGGAYSIPKALLAELPNATIDVAEIEPSLFELGQKYFNLKDNPNFHNYTEDGRRLLYESDKKYDFIFSDVYYSLFSVPPHFTTQEFFSLAKEKLSDDGIFIANLVGDLSRQRPSFIFSEIRTFQTVFSNSYFFALGSLSTNGPQNVIFVGYNGNKKIDLSDDLLRDKAINLDRFNLSSYPILTDNYSPVDYFTASTIRRAYTIKSLPDGNEMMAVIDQQLRYGPRYLGAPGHDNVQKFLIAEMEEQADEVVSQSWDYRGTDGKIYNLTNIIGRLYPARERRIILATHYDSKKLADKDFINKNKPVPGANDSASGVAVLIELARALGGAQTAPNVGVDIVFFDGEEGDVNQGSNDDSWKPLGSIYFSEHLSELYGKNKPLFALVLDMLCDKDLKIYKEQSSAQNAKMRVDSFWNIARAVNNNVFQDKIGQQIRDDHTPLGQAGIPSFLLIDFKYPPFHTTADTLDKCGAESLAIVARAVLDYTYSIP